VVQNKKEEHKHAVKKKSFTGKLLIDRRGIILKTKTSKNMYKEYLPGFHKKF
jgi:hypothetical protein